MACRVEAARSARLGFCGPRTSTSSKVHFPNSLISGWAAILPTIYERQTLGKRGKQAQGARLCAPGGYDGWGPAQASPPTLETANSAALIVCVGAELTFKERRMLSFN